MAARTLPFEHHTLSAGMLHGLAPRSLSTDHSRMTCDARVCPPNLSRFISRYCVFFKRSLKTRMVVYFNEISYDYGAANHTICEANMTNDEFSLLL